ncbi:MAG: 4'-phosphopantetheinyl transferase family protein [Anaerolineales bacterium]
MQALTAWQLPPAHWVLADSAVHLWRIPLTSSDAVVQELSRLLADDECRRAERFHFAADQRRFRVARGALRVILGHYLSMLPAQLRLAYGSNGRPELAHTSADALRFNVSHSNELALVAVTRGRAIGVDVEALRPVDQADDIVRRYCSASEFNAYQALPDSQRPLAFFNLWTRKEAYLKAVGAGLGGGLEQVEVTVLPGQPARLEAITGDTVEAAQWRLWSGEPQPGYIAALAWRDHDCELTCWQWDERALNQMEV